MLEGCQAYDEKTPPLLLFSKLLVMTSFLLTLRAATHFDVVVYGGTAGGVMTAIAAARNGARTAMLKPRAQLGGMVAGGLSGTDLGKREVIGGLAVEFYYRAGRAYGLERFQQEIAWMPEPKVAAALLRSMLQEAGVTLLEHHRLQEKTGVHKTGSRITEIVMENGAIIKGRAFADASCEGDLMAQAGVSYTYGRESSVQYGESLALPGPFSAALNALTLAMLM
jgi:flavin-dependent dehydrogenase